MCLNGLRPASFELPRGRAVDEVAISLPAAAFLILKNGCGQQREVLSKLSKRRGSAQHHLDARLGETVSIAIKCGGRNLRPIRVPFQQRAPPGCSKRHD